MVFHEFSSGFPMVFLWKSSPSAAPHRAAIVLRAPRGAAVPLRQRRADLCGGRRRAAGGWRLLGRLALVMWLVYDMISVHIYIYI